MDHLSSQKSDASDAVPSPSLKLSPPPLPLPASRRRAVFFAFCQLSNYILAGGGVLAMTGVIASGGWLTGLLLFGAFALLNWISLNVLLQAALCSGCYSMESLALRTFGSVAEKFVIAMIILNGLGMLAVQLNIAGNAVNFVVWKGDPSQSNAANPASITAYLVIGVLMPLCFLNSEKLAFTAFLSLVPLVYLFLYQMVYIGQRSPSQISPSKGDAGTFFANLAAAVFSYMCQQGMFSIFNGLRGQQQPTGTGDPRLSIPTRFSISRDEFPTSLPVMQGMESSLNMHGVAQEQRDTPTASVSAAVAAVAAVADGDSLRSYSISASDGSSSNTPLHAPLHQTTTVLPTASHLSAVVGLKGASDERVVEQAATELMKIHWVTMLICFFVYYASGILGGAVFPDTTQGNILLTYPASSSFDGLNIIMAMSVLLSCALIIFPMREGVDKLLFPNRPLTSFRYVLQNVVLAWLAYAIVVAFPNYRTIVDLAGALTGTFISFIFPCVFYLKAARAPLRGDMMGWTAVFVLAIGGTAGLMSLCYVISAQVHG